MRLLVALSALLFAAPSFAADDSIGTVNEGSTGFFRFTFCDQSTVTTDRDCTDGGQKVTASDITALNYRIDDVATGKQLLATTTVASVTANPYELATTAASHVMVGRCSSAGTACVTAAADCPTGQTCVVKDRAKEPEQLHVLTLFWTWDSGTKTSTARIPFRVRNLEEYPFP